MRKIIFLLTLLSIFPCVFAQKKDITLEDIWTKNTFPVEHEYGLASMADGQHYTSILWEGKTTYSLIKYNYKTGKKVATLVKSEELVPAGSSLPITMDDYSFSTD